MSFLRHLPNVLTFSRIALIPLIVGCFYAAFPFSSFLAAGLLSLACLTDYIDGYLARTYQYVSKLGTFLDPIADKMLISIVLLALANEGIVQGFSLIPASLILSREIMISGLREYLGLLRVALPVSPFSKWKTAFQMVSLIILFVSKEQTLSPHFQTLLVLLGTILLWLSAVLALITAYQYVRSSKGHLTDDVF